ncbi:helix-turn-helix domain-containing protein [Ancylobacter radicis]|uniref:Helix-turn-helix domain-containing protein n=1 Tax=Ancylobacter radicis TaxID=2836179 RepID=A0ABS5R4T0_9HYPH|nr:helix-turn-helix domain-containing protein [Ancylobacter radicis]MBS9476222.1 hypothetical protein [Ancylobacter radicis]
MIIRRRYNRNFTVLPNTVLDDDRLSAEAMGVLCYLRSRPADWNVELSHLSERFRIGRDKTQRVVAELVDAGWIKRERTRDPVTRAFNGIDYVVYDEPADTSDSVSEADQPSEPQPENPVVAHPALKHHPQPALPRAAFQAVHIEEPNTEKRTNTPIAPKGAVGEESEKLGKDDPQYQKFIREYAPPPTASLTTPLRHWAKLSEAQRVAAISSVAPYRTACKAERRKLADPSTYLSRRLFENFQTSTVPRAPDSPAVAALRAALSPNFSGGVLVEINTPAWRAWEAVADEAGYPLRAILYPARPIAGRPKAATGRFLPSEWPPTREGPDRRQQAAGEEMVGDQRG